MGALLFARHGNTFEAGQVARIVGAHEDMPLTEAGKEQARVLGRAIKESGLPLGAVVCGPLSRTKVFAEVAALEAGHQGEIRIDPRLRELDFGDWSGLSDDEVAQRYGQDVLDAWRRDGARPKDVTWAPAESLVRADLASLSQELGAPKLANKENGNNQATLCVTSNGVLRYAMELDPAAFADRGKEGGFRVKTGRLCAFRPTQNGLELVFWDEIPRTDLLSQLKA